MSVTPQPGIGVWHSRSAEVVLTKTGSAATGLAEQEAAKRLAADGRNQLTEGKRIGPFQIFLGQFKSLIIWILIVAGVVSGVLGEMVDAIAIRHQSERSRPEKTISPVLLYRGIPSHASPQRARLPPRLI